jgi:hypothetical protein
MDSDPGGQKTYVSYGSGTATLAKIRVYVLGYLYAIPNISDNLRDEKYPF